MQVVLFAGALLLPCRSDTIVFSEIMYAPVGGSDYEFIELFNAGGGTVALHNAYFSEGIAYRFTNTSLAAGARLVVVGDYATFTSRYHGVTNVVRASYGGSLANEGERVTLRDSAGDVLCAVTYDDQGRWPERANGLGSSLVLLDALGNPDSPTNWCASAELHGSPGIAGNCSVCDVVINELMTHADPPFEDAIELRNGSAAAMDLDGWYLSDDVAVRDKYCISNVTIQAGGHAVFYEYQFNNTGDALNIAFALSEYGERVFLTASVTGQLTRFVDGVEFGAAENGISLGRYPDGTGVLVSLSRQTFGTTNPATLAEFRAGHGASNAYPRVGPVVVNEIMYHPPDVGDPPQDNDWDEYLELWNASASTAKLYDVAHPTNTWKLTNAVHYVFPTNVSILPGARVLVVGTTNIAAFRAAYGMGPVTRIYGPWAGKLDNGGESVRLCKPGDPDTNGVPYVEVDRVDYRDESPWPPGADGTGCSLERTQLLQYGNDPSNWHLGPYGGTPGRINTVATSHPPVALLRADTPVFEQTAAALDGSDSYDPDGGALRYEWRQVAGPAGAFSSSNTATTVFLPPAITSDDVARIALVVTDDPGGSATASVDVVLVNVGTLAGGVLSADTTWTSGNSPVGIRSNLTVLPGVTLNLQQGTRVIVDRDVSVVVRGTLNVSASAGQEAEFDCIDSNRFWGGIGFANGATGQLRHCVLRHGSSAVVDGATWRGAISARDGYLGVVECLAEDMSGVCFYAERCDVVFVSNVVRRTGEGINIAKCRAVLEDNRISFIRDDGDGIDVDSEATPTPGNPTPSIRIARNVIWSVTGDGIDLGDAAPDVDANLVFLCGDKGLSLGERATPVMKNNLVWGCRIGLAIKDESNPTIVHHTLVGNRVGVSCYENEKNRGAGGGRGEIVNSIIWGNGTSLQQDDLSLTSVRYSIVEGDPAWWGEGNTNADPGFVSWTNMDFRLKAGSVAVDRGSAAYAPDHDLAGTARPQGVGADLGALERTAAVTDVDRDGVPDATDAFVGDYRYAQDSDRDGLPDAWELEFFGNTNQPAGGDYDGDGLSQRAEYAQGSNPMSSGNEDIIINEVHYHPASGNSDDEFVEIYNRGTNTIDLSGWSMTDEILFHFPTGTQIGPEAYVVVANDPNALANKVYGAEVLGPFSPALGNGPGIIRLNDDRLHPVDVAPYDTATPWPGEADGFGPSLERCAPGVDAAYITNWRASRVFGGTPGRRNSQEEEDADVVFNEVLCSPALAGGDWLELFNRGTNGFDLSDHYLSDDAGQLTKYRVSAGTILAAGGCRLFMEADLGFGLDAQGESLFLTAPDGHTVISEAGFGLQQTNVSFARFPDGTGAWFFCDAPTPGATNGRSPVHAEIVINEIMYHPSADENDELYEYIELHNTGGTAVGLGGWTMGDGFGYSFPPSASILPGDYLVLAHDPASVTNRYGISGVWGPFTSGKLSDGGERVALMDALGNVVDQVRYDDTYPWPAAADGSGASLELVHPSLDNAAPTAWRASRADIAPTGTPGAVNSVFATNGAPVISATAHSPTVPLAGEPVEILTRSLDGDGGVASVCLSWKEDGATGWTTTNMAAGRFGTYRAVLPGFASSNLILYYVRAFDASSNSVTAPEGAPMVTMKDTSNLTTKTYLCLVDSCAHPTNLPLYRLLTSATNWSELGGRDPYSNELLDGTLLVGAAVYPNVGYRYRAQLRSNFNTTNLYNLRIELGGRRVHGDGAIDISNTSSDDNEYLASEFFQREGFPSYDGSSDPLCPERARPRLSHRHGATRCRHDAPVLSGAHGRQRPDQGLVRGGVRILQPARLRCAPDAVGTGLRGGG